MVLRPTKTDAPMEGTSRPSDPVSVPSRVPGNECLTPGESAFNEEGDICLTSFDCRVISSGPERTSLSKITVILRGIFVPRSFNT